MEEELAGYRYGDGGLDRRLHQPVEQMEAGFGESIPLACQARANTKAGYRLFSNDRVSEENRSLPQDPEIGLPDRRRTAANRREVGQVARSVLRPELARVLVAILNRTDPDPEPALVLTEIEIKLLDRLIPDPEAGSSTPKTVPSKLIKIAKLSAYLARAKDAPPSNIVMWRRLSRLNDIALGATLQINDADN